MFAYNDWLPVTPEELKMTSIPQQPGAPAVVLYHEEIYNDPLHSQAFYTRVKILTDAGKKYADIQIPYSRDYQGEVRSVHGRTIQPDGSISDFEGKPIDRVLEKGNGHKWNVKSFAVPNAQVGSIVEYRYVRDYSDQWFIAPQWELQGELFRIKEYFSFIPTHHDLIMKHDAVGRGVAWSWRVPPNSPAPVENRLTGKIDLTLTNMPAFIEEPYMPPANLFRYNVHFFYNTNRGKAAEFWKEEGKYWNKEVQHFIGKQGPAFAEAMKSTVVATDTPEQKARKIYAYVQGLQNLDYAPKRSEEEMKALGLKEARGVEDVVRQKMGDSEDLARLYLAMARAANLDVRMMRVTSREDSYFDVNYLDFDQLDHEIVLLRLGTNEVHLDPGVRFCPFGILYWKDADASGLVQKEGSKETELSTVQSDEYKDAWLRRDADFKLTENGELEGTLKVTFKGQRALILRIDNWKTDADGKKKALEDEVKGWLPVNAEIELTNTPDWESDQDLVAIFKVTTPGASGAGHRALLPLDIFQHGRPSRLPHAEREFPVNFDFPWRTTDHITITLPLGFQIENVPAPVKQGLEYALYQVVLVNKTTAIECVRDLAVAGTVFPTPNYPELKSFFDKVKAGDDLEAVVKGIGNGAGN
jgi:hypothetical protein